MVGVLVWVIGRYLWSVAFCRDCMAGVLGCRTLHMFCILQELYGWYPGLLVRLSDISVLRFTICLQELYGGCSGLLLPLFCCIVQEMHDRCPGLLVFCIMQELYGWYPVLLVRFPDITYVLFYFAGTVWSVSFMLVQLLDVTYVLFHFAGTLRLVSLMFVRLPDMTCVLLYFAGTVCLVYRVVGAVVKHYLCSVVFCRNCTVSVLGCQTFRMFYCILLELCPVLLVCFSDITCVLFLEELYG